MQKQELVIETGAGVYNLICAMAIVLDIVATALPSAEAQIRRQIERKRDELAAHPETADAAATLQVLLNTLTLSPRALQRQAPAGEA